MFRVVFLKKFQGESPTGVAALPHIVNGRAVATPAQVVCAKLNRTSWDLLVQWTGRPAADATWESLKQFKENYPEFKLEDEPDRDC